MTLLEVEPGAAGTELVVEVMQLPEAHLAHVAGAQLGKLDGRIGIGRLLLVLEQEGGAAARSGSVDMTIGHQHRQLLQPRLLLVHGIGLELLQLLHPASSQRRAGNVLLLVIRLAQLLPLQSPLGNSVLVVLVL